jgi:hypothetical protein
MAWQDARTEGEKWVGENLPTDLRGHSVQLVKFERDSHARFFDVNRGQKWHAMFTTAVARLARKRGAKIVYVTITPDQYRDWLAGRGAADADDQRSAWLAAMQQFGED